MEQLELAAVKRSVTGKKVRFLRRKGLAMAHLYGNGVTSESLEGDSVQFRKVLTEAGKTRLIQLHVGGEQTHRNVLVREIQQDPLTRQLVHVDLYEVSMTEKIEVQVPIVMVGDAPAMKTKDLMISQELDTLNVECFPNQIPNQIEVDVTALAELNQAVHVKDLKLGGEIGILNDPEQSIVRIILRPMERVEAVAPTAEAVAAPAEGAAPATGAEAPKAAEKK